MPSSNKSLVVILSIVAAVALVAAYLFFAPTKPVPAPVTASAPAPRALVLADAPESAPDAPAATPAPAPSPIPEETPIEIAASLDPVPLEGMLFDGHVDPRAFEHEDLTGGFLPAGYRLEGLRATPGGIQLEPAEDDGPRQGVVYSPIFDLMFASNAVSPMWKVDLPDGTDTFVEFQVSNDKEKWGPWQWVVVDEDSINDIMPTFPDGRANPNYGYVPGGAFVWGNDTYRYMRFRATLYGEGKATPTLASVRFFYQDTTRGEGKPAVLDRDRSNEDVTDYQADSGEPAPEADAGTPGGAP